MRCKWGGARLDQVLSTHPLVMLKEDPWPLLLRHCTCILDIIGICKSYEDVTKITVKSNNREVAKRNIYLMDMSGKVVTATLWGDDVSTCSRQRDLHSWVVLSSELWSFGHIGGKELCILAII
jgi:hypothetical protein